MPKKNTLHVSHTPRQIHVKITYFSLVSITNMAAAEHVDDEGDTEDKQRTASAEDDGHPWSYLGTMFSYLGMGQIPKK